MRKLFRMMVGLAAVALFASLLTTVNVGTASSDQHDTPDAAYWLVAEDGEVFVFGEAEVYGNAVVPDGAIAIDLVSAPDGLGYWILLSDGSVQHFGSAGEIANTVALPEGEAAVAFALTTSGAGLWVFGASGSVALHGDAVSYGDASDIDLNEDIIDAVVTADGLGYYMLGKDGGVFTFGSARFHGSVPGVLPAGVDLNCPVVGIVLTPAGYWVVACDGGIFSFGDAPFRGSIPGVLAPGVDLVAPATGMVSFGNGYLVVAEDGGVFDFADITFLGSLGGQLRDSPIRSIGVRAGSVAPPVVDPGEFDGCVPIPSQFNGIGISTVDCSLVKVWPPLHLTFSGDDTVGLVASNDVNTGFTMHLPATGVAPAGDLSSVVVEDGVLRVTAGAGTMAGALNTQQDAIGVGLPLPDVPIALNVTLVDPTVGEGAGEQSGVWFGLSESDNARLFVESTPTGPVAKFVLEIEDQETLVDEVPVTAGSLELELLLDPTAEDITARIIRGDEVTEFDPTAGPSAWFGKDAAGIDFNLGTRSFAGIFATSGPAAGDPLVVEFDDFLLDTYEPVGPPIDPPVPPVDEGVTVDFDAWIINNISFPTAITVGPDGRVYVAEAFGTIHRLDIDHDNRTVQRTTINTLGARLVLGITVDPRSTADDVSIWVQHSNPSFNSGAANSGAVTRLFGNNLNQKQDIITGLPRAIANHAPNSLHFGTDGRLYMVIGGNTGAGASNDGISEFGGRPEQPLSAALIVADVFANGFDGTCKSTIDPNGTQMDATGISATDVPCDVEVYASGLRNAYDFVEHSNGHIYATDNGLGVEGTFPDLQPNDLAWDPGDGCEGRINGAAARLAHNPGKRPDLLIDIEEGAYYGHPNPSRGECVFYAGNPTNGKDGAIPKEGGGTVGLDTTKYPVGVQAEPTYQAPMYSLGDNRSANGIIEYTAHAFCGSLNEDLLITYYSQGDSVRRIELNASGNSVTSSSVLRGTTTANGGVGLSNPLPIAQDSHGRLYVGEFGGGGRVRVFEPDSDACWESSSPTDIPVKLLDAGSAVIDDRIYAVGGKTTGGQHLRSLWIYDTNTHEWAAGADLPAAYPAVENPAVVAHDGLIYAFGGSTAPFSGAVTSAAVYDPDSDSWTMLPSMSIGRGGPGAAVMGDQVYLVGGLSATGESLASVEVYDIGDDDWSAGPSLSVPRDNPMVGNADGVIVVAGGRTRNVAGLSDDGTLDSVERLVGGNWVAAADMPTGRRTGNAVVVDDTLIVMGGERQANGATYDDVEQYDPNTNSWTVLEPMPVGRHGAVVGLVDRTIFVMGGGTTGGSSFTSTGSAFHLG